MAVSIAQYVDLLFKKLQGVAKTANSTVKGASNESIASPAFLRGDVVWMQADQIPATAQTVGNITLALTGTSSVQCAADTTVPPIGGIRPTWLTGETYWISQEFGATWLPKVYVGPSGAANIEATGTQIFAAGIGGVGEYYFDTQAGVLNFIGETIPAVLTSGNVVYVSGYQYVGDLGVTNIPSGANIGGLQVNGNTITAITGNVINLGNAISVAGNVTATNFIGNISGNIDAAGSNTWVQFNDTGDILGASAGFTFDKTANLLTVTGNVVSGNVLVGNIVIPGTGNITVANVNINNLADPVENQDAATKYYVDNAIPVISNQTINPDGLTATYTLNQSAVDVGVLVTINGVTQTPTTNYTIAGNQITFGSTPDQTDIIQVRFLAGSSAIINNYGNSNVVSLLTSYGSNVISTTGNITANTVTAQNFIGNISITGNVTGTSSNVTLVAGSYSYTFDNTGIATFPTVGGDEGGEIHFGVPTANTTLVDSVKIDVYQDRLRFFEGSANAKGAYIDLANCANGVATAIGYRDIPQITFSANATAAINAAGCHYYSTTAGNLALTLPDNSSVAFPTGATLTIVVNAAGNVLVNQGTGVSLYQAGASATGNRVVGAYGLATVMKVAANTWVISGTGVY